MDLVPLITLYDIPIDVGGKVSTPSTWKARYALNFKGIPYKTVWIEYPDVERVMRCIGAPPSSDCDPDGTPHYLLPVLVDASCPAATTTTTTTTTTTSTSSIPTPTPTVVCGPWNIVAHLDRAYPAPAPLIPAGTKALQAVFINHFFETVMRPCMPILLPDVHGRLSERSRPYYRWISEIIMNDTLEQLCPLGSTKREETWATIHKGFSSFAALLLDDSPSALVMGKQPTFADLAIAAFLETLLLLHPEEWNARVRTWHGGRWEALRKSCDKWKQ